MNVQDIVNTVSQKAGLDQGTTEKVVGTIFSGWLTDRVDPRVLLVVYYLGRGVSLLLLPSLLSPHAEPSTWVFVIFYGLDWVATVPPSRAVIRTTPSTAVGGKT